MDPKLFRIFNQFIFAGPDVDDSPDVELEPNGEKSEHEDEVKRKFLHVFLLLGREGVLVAVAVFVGVRQGLCWNVVHDKEQGYVDENSLNQNVEVAFLECLSSLIAVFFVVIVVRMCVHDVHNIEKDEVKAEPFFI